jgi:hypothetical protein
MHPANFVTTKGRAKDGEHVPADSQRKKFTDMQLARTTELSD